MEKSLLIGDFLFVSKVAYGPRVPMTPLAFPLVHHTMPIVGGKSYSESLKLPYHRMKGLGNIERNDCVVFNWPAENIGRPVDKKENYVKSSLEVKDYHKQPMGMVHGGVIDTMAEAAISYAAYFTQEGTWVGVNNNTDFIKGVTEGVIICEATPIKLGKRSQIWEAKKLVWCYTPVGIKQGEIQFF